MSEELTRDFKGVWIPVEIYLDDRLNALDKIILVEIDSLDGDENGCYASNKYLAEFCQCTETKISTSINKLIKLNYLEIIKFDGRKRYIKSRLKKNERQTLKNLKADFKNFKDNNIYNNIYNNKKEIYKEKLIPPSLKEIEDYIKEKKLKVNAKDFYDYFTEGNWIDSRGQKVKNWKLKIRTWNSYNNNYNNKEVSAPKWFDQTNNTELMTQEDKEELDNILKVIGE